MKYQVEYSERVAYLVEELQTMEIERLLQRLKQYDETGVTFEHSLRVGEMCGSVGEVLGLCPKDVRTITMAGYLHDIGKLFVPKEILQKPDKLNEEEREMIKNHPHRGIQLIKRIVPPEAEEGVAGHHEFQEDPYGRRGAERRAAAREEKNDRRSAKDFGTVIAQVIAVCDTYDAHRYPRPYKLGMSLEDALSLVSIGYCGDEKYLHALGKVLSSK